MKLNRKKELVSRTIGVGKGRILFNKERLSEIKEAITKQDIRDLVESKAIMIREITGRRKVERRRTRRRIGSIRKKISNRKRKYIILTRRLRSYVLGLKKRGAISKDLFWQLRKEIKAKSFKDLSHFKERIKGEGK